MKRVYFTICWNRGTPELDAVLDISDVTPEDGNFVGVCKRVGTTDSDHYRNLAEKAGRLGAAAAAIDIRMRFNPHHDGPFIVSAEDDILDRDAIEVLVRGKHATGELVAWLDSARVSSSAAFRRA